jgi:hypothetical protein
MDRLDDDGLLLLLLGTAPANPGVRLALKLHNIFWGTCPALGKFCAPDPVSGLEWRLLAPLHTLLGLHMT